MLCYGQGALATASYSPPPIRWLGAAFLLFGCITLALGTAAAVPMMSIAFGLGHISLVRACYCRNGDNFVSDCTAT